MMRASTGSPCLGTGPPVGGGVSGRSGVAEHVNPQHRLPLGLLGVDEHAVPHDAGVADQHVEAAERVDRQAAPSRRPCPSRRRRQVGGGPPRHPPRRSRRPPAGPGCRTDPTRPGHPQVVDDDPGASAAKARAWPGRVPVRLPVTITTFVRHRFPWAQNRHPVTCDTNQVRSDAALRGCGAVRSGWRSRRPPRNSGVPPVQFGVTMFATDVSMPVPDLAVAAEERVRLRCGSPSTPASRPVVGPHRPPVTPSCPRSTSARSTRSSPGRRGGAHHHLRLGTGVMLPMQRRADRDRQGRRHPRTRPGAGRPLGSGFGWNEDDGD